MEQVIEFYNNWKKIENYMLFLKKLANWLCLVNNDYEENCAVHRFLLKLEETIKQTEWTNQIDEFIVFTIKNEEIFKFFESCCRNTSFCRTKMNKLFIYLFFNYILLFDSKCLFYFFQPKKFYIVRANPIMNYLTRKIKIISENQKN